MSQITLVSHKHDDDIRVRMVAKFLQPSSNVVIGLVLADVVNEKSPNGAPVVGGRDGSIALLSCGVPNLRLNCFRVNLNGSRGKLDTDGRL